MKNLILTTLLLLTLISPTQASAYSFGTLAQDVFCGINQIFNTGACTPLDPVSDAQVHPVSNGSNKQKALDSLIGKQLYKPKPSPSFVPTPQPQIIQRITNPVIERTIHTKEIIREIQTQPTPQPVAGVTLATFQSALNKLRSELYQATASQALTASYGARVAPRFPNTWGLSQKIDNLGLVDISNSTLTSSTITNSSISGSTGSFTTLAVSGGSTLSGDLTIAANNNFTQAGTGTFSTGTGATTLNGATTATGDLTVGGATTLNGNTTLGNAATDTTLITGLLNMANSVVQGALALVFEGATEDAFETTLAITDPTADRTITLQDASGTVALTSDISSTLYNGDGTIGAGRTVAVTDTVNFDSNTFVIDGVNDRVGIGTTGPDRKLDILDTSAAQLRLTYTDGSIYTDFQTDPSGNLSITPSNNFIYIKGSDIRTDSGYGFKVDSYNTSLVNNVLTLYGAGKITGDVSGNLTFNDGTDDNVTILNTGNVGIGETAPGSKLSVSGGASIGASYDTTAAPSNGLIIQGNLGIGTTGPTELLTVSNADGNDDLDYIARVLNNDVTNGQSHGLKIQAGNGSSDGVLYVADRSNSPLLYVRGDGNVGIGTTSPSNLLHIDTNAWDKGIRLERTRGSIGGPRDISIGIAGVDGHALGFSSHGGATNGYDMVIRESGNVGIGTTAPVAQLHISKAGKSTLILSDTTNSVDLQLRSDSSGGWLRTVTNNKLYLGANHGTHVTINTSGNVGIGETAPGSKLSVSGGASIGASYDTTAAPSNGLIIQGNLGIGTTSPSQLLHLSGSGVKKIQIDAGSPIINFNDTEGAADNWDVGVNVSAGGSPQWMDFLVWNQTTDKGLLIDRSGNVGIGTTNPSQKLSVVGDVSISTLTNVTDLQTNASGVIIDGASDESLKNIQGDFTRGIDAILQINPITYSWKDGIYFRDGEESGFSAQNLQLAIPEAVKVNSRDYLSVSDRPILAVVVNALKEVWAKVTENTQRIVQLVSKDNELEARIASLESQLAASLPAGQAGGGSGSASGDSGSSQDGSSTSFVPTIVIMGNNPAEVEIGASYSDLGASAQNPDGNDLSIATFVDGVEVQSVDLITATDITYIIEYRAQWEDQTVTAERTVIVGTGAPTEQQDQPQDDEDDDPNAEDGQSDDQSDDGAGEDDPTEDYENVGDDADNAGSQDGDGGSADDDSGEQPEE